MLRIKTCTDTRTFAISKLGINFVVGWYVSAAISLR